MKILLNIICNILVFLLFFYSTILAEENNVDKVLKVIDNFRSPGPNFMFYLDVLTKNSEKEISFGMQVRVRENTNSLVVYTKPVKSAGKKILMIGNNMWIYIPGTRRALRISTSQQMMGGVANADVARVAYSLDYTVVSQEKTVLESLPGRNLSKIELKAKSPAAAYDKILFWAEAENSKPFKSEFFSLSGRKLKTAFYKTFQQVLGQEICTQIEIYDEIDKSNVVVMTYSDFQLVETREDFYQPNFLPRLKLSILE